MPIFYQINYSHRTYEWPNGKVSGLYLDQAVWVEALVGVIATHITFFATIENPEPPSSGYFLSAVCSFYGTVR